MSTDRIQTPDRAEITVNDSTQIVPSDRQRPVGQVVVIGGQRIVGARPFETLVAAIDAQLAAAAGG